MARAIERIERDILALEEATRAIATELQSADTGYLTALGQALRQQLILATYHLCTQGYPDNFLSLSLNQRQQLQQAIRKLGQQASEELLNLSIRQKDEGDEGDEADEGDEGDEADEGDEGDEGDEEDEQIHFSFPFPPTNFPDHTPDAINHVSPKLPTSLTPLTSFSPTELAIWQQNLEKGTYKILKKVSRETNLLLQKAGILPKKLPEQILEAAAAASESSAEVMPGPPNLLSLVIEIENGRQSEHSKLTQIMAINLRLGEIEFADAALSSQRKQIRIVLAKLNKLGQEYQKKQHERLIAEAESAWRASWVDEL